MKYSMTEQEKKRHLNTGDCFIELTAWAGLTVFHIVNNVMKHIFKIQF